MPRSRPAVAAVGAAQAVVAAPPDPVERRLADDPVLRALLRRQAKVEGKTLARIVAELKAEFAAAPPAS